MGAYKSPHPYKIPTPWRRSADGCGLMATIRERKPGVFEVRAFVGRDLNGRPVQISKTVRGTKRDATRFAHELDSEASSARGARTRVAELLDLWIETSEGSWAPSTLDTHRSRVSLINADPIASMTLARLAAPDVDAWHVRLAKRGVGEGSIRNQHLVLRAALGLAVRWGWLRHNAASAAPLGSRKRSPRGALSEAEVRGVLDAAQGLVERSVLEPAAAVALRLACVTGARRSELAALRWEDLDGSRLTIDSSIAVVRDRGPGGVGHPQLRDDPTKTGNRRVVTLDAATIAALDSLRAHPGMLGPWILAHDSRPVSPDRISAWWRRARDAVGVDQKWRLHDLRHWSATTSIAAGHDVRSVAGRLGHANPSMTLRVYAHVVEAADAALAETLGEVLSRDDAAPA
jgi:integrase